MNLNKLYNKRGKSWIIPNSISVFYAWFYCYSSQVIESKEPRLIYDELIFTSIRRKGVPFFWIKLVIPFKSFVIHSNREKCSGYVYVTLASIYCCRLCIPMLVWLIRFHLKSFDCWSFYLTFKGCSKLNWKMSSESSFIHCVHSSICHFMYRNDKTLAVQRRRKETKKPILFGCVYTVSIQGAVWLWRIHCFYQLLEYWSGVCVSARLSLI